MTLHKSTTPSASLQWIESAEVRMPHNSPATHGESSLAKWASKLAVIFRRSWRNMTRRWLGVYGQARLHLRGAKWGRWERPLKGETRDDNDIIKECLKIIKARRWSEAPSRFLAPLRWNIHTPAPAGDHHFPLHLSRSVLLLRGGGRFAAATRRRKRQSTQNVCAIFSYICCISF